MNSQKDKTKLQKLSEALKKNLIRRKKGSLKNENNNEYKETKNEK